MSELLPCPFCGGEPERIGVQGTIRCKVHTMRTHDGVFPCPAHGSEVTFGWIWNIRADNFTPSERAFFEAAKAHAWYERQFSGDPEQGGGGFGLKECQEADAAKQAFMAAYLALSSHAHEKEGT